MVLEPTCGIGSFLVAAVDCFSRAQLLGWDINAGYVQQARSALAHSGASGRALVEVQDEGPGFDAPALVSRPRTAHFGLRLLRDAVVDSGVEAELAVRSAPSAGTTWRLTARV